MHRTRRLCTHAVLTLSILAAAGTTGCGGAGGDDDDDGADGADGSDAGDGSPELFAVVVEVSGLHGSLTATLGAEELVIGVDGVHTFAAALADGASYDVAVPTIPGVQTCEVADAAGTIAGADAVVAVTCADLYFFAAWDAEHGRELWKTDGTHEGTAMVADIWPGTSESMPDRFARVRGTVYFVATDGAEHGSEVWRTDGTPEGTALVADLGEGTNPRELAQAAGHLVFIAGSTERRVYRSDGNASGTAPLSDVPVVDADAILVAGDDEVFLTSKSVDDQWRRLYAIRLDGSGTEIVKDAHPSMHGVTANRGVFVGGLYVFEGEDAGAGHELWRSDGTAAGTSLVRDAAEGQLHFPFEEAARLGERIVFRGPGVDGNEPWITDGTASGTIQLGDISPEDGSHPVGFVPYTGGAAFSTNIGQLFVTDGIGITPVALDDLAVNDILAASAAQIVFIAYPDGSAEPELWRHDVATGEATRIKVFQLTLPGAARIFDRSVFVADDGTGATFWVTDGTAAGTMPLLP